MVLMARVLWFGNYVVPWTTETHVTRELEALGHYVRRVQEPQGGGDRRTCEELQKIATGEAIDVVFWQRTWGLPRQAIDTWRQLEAEGIRTASFHLDLYVGLQREHGLIEDPFWRTGTVFTADGDDHSQVVFDNLGINHVWSPSAVVSDECVPGRVRPEWQFDVIFVGSPARSYHPEWSHRAELLAFLERESRRKGWSFARFGPGAQTVRGDDLNDLYASAKIVVGDSLCPPGHRNYWSDRPYETVGRGGFLLMPRVPGLEDHFYDGIDLRFWEFGHFDQLSEWIGYYLERPAIRDSIRQAGQAHVRREHTYCHRLAAVMDRLGLSVSATVP